jgi:hypothetical protein
MQVITTGNFIGEGLYKTDHYRRTTRGRSPFFLYRTTLYSGHYTLKANQYKWPFEFTFPAQTDPTCIEDSFASRSPWYGTSQAHVLPPSFLVHLNQSEDRTLEGRVEYTLEALAERPGTFKSNFNFVTQFQFNQQPRDEASPNPRLFAQEEFGKARSAKLIPDAHPSLKDKVHGLFKPNDLPTANFIVRWLYPTVIYPGGKLPLYFAVVAIETLNGAPSNEKIAVNVSELVIKFKSGSHLRSNSDQDVVEEEYLLHNSREPFKLPSFHIEGKTQPKTTPYEYQENLKEEEGLAYIPVTGLTTPKVEPTFATINIALQHRLKVKMKVECGGKTSTMEFSGVTRVLPSEVKPNSPFPAAFENIETILPAYEIEDLPAYSTAT